MDAGLLRDHATDEGAAAPAPADTRAVRRCRRKFLRFFRKGFYDPKYIDWERGYKWQAHREWDAAILPLGARIRRVRIETHIGKESAAKATGEQPRY